MRVEIENNTIYDEGGIYPADVTIYKEYEKDYSSGKSHPATPAEHIYRRTLKLLALLLQLKKYSREPTYRLIIESQISSICEVLRICKQEMQIEGGRPAHEVIEEEDKRNINKHRDARKYRKVL
jgi:hypothetical protein